MLHLSSAYIMRGATSLFFIDSCIVRPGELSLLIAPNGAGKSSFAAALMGHPDYQILGSALFDAADIQQLSLEQRAQRGLFVSYQQPVAIPGLSVRTYFLEICRARGIFFDTEAAFESALARSLESVGLAPQTMARGLYDGFSGGERKRLELAHLSFLAPPCAILDEVDSGLDEMGVAQVESLLCNQKAAGAALLVITHHPLLLKAHADRLWTIRDQRLVEI
jgi:Fe-S cluster assembly ATP-binding protein